MICASLASIPQREKSLEKTVASILPNVQYLHVYLNKYRHVPNFLINNKIIVARSQDYGDNGDAGKFFWSDKIKECYHFTCDDDLIYNNEYFTFMIQKIEQYNRKIIVGGCGSVIVGSKSKYKNYYNDRISYHFHQDIEKDVFVNNVGTGTSAYHTSTLDISPFDFKSANMADIWLSILAKNNNVPMVKIKFEKDPKKYIEINPDYNQHDTIYHHSAVKNDKSNMNTGERQTIAVLNNFPWTIKKL